MANPTLVVGSLANPRVTTVTITAADAVTQYQIIVDITRIGADLTLTGAALALSIRVALIHHMRAYLVGKAVEAAASLTVPGGVRTLVEGITVTDDGSIP